MKKLYYFVYKEENITINFEKFVNFINRVLTDSRGWKGYKFICLNLKSTSNKKEKDKDFSIILSTPKSIQNKCKLYGLSCTDSHKKTIYINSNRYKKGSIHSKLSLKDYRIYLINHEVGHILGKGHVHHSTISPGQLVPVMNQATKGIGKCKPNPWPTKLDNKL